MKNIMLMIAISLLIGIFIASKLFMSILIIMSGFLLVLVLAFFNRQRRERLTPIFMLAVCFFGMLEYTVFYKSDSRLAGLAEDNINVQCIITDDPIRKSSYYEFNVKTVSASENGKTYNYREKLIVKYRGKESFKYGDLIQVDGQLLSIAVKRNPGDFDYKLYYKSKGIHNLLQAQSIKLIKHNKQMLVFDILHAAKNRIKTIIFRAMPDEEAAMIFGMLTGDKDEIDDDTMETFKASGISHILSVSGLHVGFLVLLLGILLKPFKLSPKKQGIIIIIVVFIYILMIGMPASALRAFIMLAVMLLGKAVNREYNLLSSISFAAVIMLIVNPLFIHNPGFIISFSCMYSIAALYEPINKYLIIVPRLVRDSLALSLAVWLGIAPVMAWYFNYISIISIALNLVAIPLAFAITIIGFAGVFIGSVFYYGSIYLFSMGYYLVKLLTYVTDISVKLWFSGIVVPTLPMYFYILYYIGILFFAGWFGSLHYENYKRYYIIGGFLTLAICIIIYNAPTNMKINYFDVGQGDSACIITPNKKVILIDAGGSTNKGQYYYDIGQKITVPALLHQGVWKIDTIIASHAHEDHVEGLVAVLNAFRVDNIIFPKLDYEGIEVPEIYRKLMELCRLKNTKVFYLSKGDTIRVSNNISIDVLWPDPAYEYLAANNLNNGSLVLKLNYKNFDALFTGDIEREVEELLVKEDLKAEVLKIPHHGSKTSSTQYFLESIDPVYGIISVGTNNFGHPSEEVLERYNKLQLNTIRTDVNGCVTIITNGIKMKLRTIK